MHLLTGDPGPLAWIPSPSTNAIHLGSFQLRAYGLLIALGVVVAVNVAQRRWAVRGGDPADVSSIATWSVIAGLAGARLYHVITDYQRFEGRWPHVFAVWEGGLGIPGGLLAGVLTGVVLARRRGLPAAELLDVVAPAIPIAQAIGRLGNWFNQELFGRPTTLPWGLRIDPEHRPVGYEPFATFHPTFLYEALWNLALAGLLVAYERRRPDARAGTLFALYVAGYGLGRLWVEALRIDAASRLLGLRVNIWVSLLAISLSIGWILRDLIRHRVDEPHPTAAGAPRSGLMNIDHQSGSAATAGRPSNRQTRHDDDHAGHGKHAGHHVEMFRRRFWWSLLLTVPLVLTSHMVMDWFGYTIDFYGMDWIGPVLGTFVFVWGGWPFLAGGVQEAKDRQPGMMLLIAMAITVAYGASMATSAGWFDLDFWWELGALISIMLLGHWQEMKALGQAQDALAALAALLPDEAERIAADGSVHTVPAEALRTGDLVLVRSGGRVPADGQIVDGEAELDESMITGESRPVAKSVGDKVVAGTISTDSAIRVEVTAVGDDTTLAGIGRLVAEAQESQSRAQVLADRAAALLFYVAVSAAIVTAIVWTALGDGNEAVVRVVTVLVISCPHALGLAIPLTTSLSSALAARNGILIKDRLALEASRTIDAVLFDKTGTLTKGEHIVIGVAAAAGRDHGEILRIAGAIEADSEHPLARAIVTAAVNAGPVAQASDFRSITGRGVEATVGGAAYAVGGPVLLRERQLTEPAEITEQTTEWKHRGAAVLYLVKDTEIIGALALEDEIRPEARQAVDQLSQMGRRVVMITGDAHQVADAVGADLGVDEVFAEVLPEDKSAKVAELQARGLKVAMVGDGVNDAPALARADVGIAIGAGTDVAIESAGLILASSDPRAVISIITLSKATYRKSLQNLTWAAGYNVIAIPVAAGAFQWAGVTMPPAVGAILMSVSTIVVAANAQLLRRLDLRPGPAAGTPEPDASTGHSRPGSDLVTAIGADEVGPP